MKILIKLLLLIALAMALAACETQDEISIRDPWARPGFAGANSAVYFTIENPTDDEEVLLGASSEVAEHAELHMSEMGEGNTMTTRPQANVPIPGGEQVTFEPGGLHVMLVNLKDDLEVGETFSLTLHFQNAEDEVIEVAVEQR